MKEVKTGENAPRAFLGKTHSAETLAKMSTTKGTAIYVYDTQDLLVNTFSSARKAGIFFEYSQNTILKYVRNDKIFKEQ
jgi:group I intron endonuclease